ncbi:unnamed protein product [Trichobilharzia regenti]|nr:unnamed protein product [Trichobilharzia regenti]
MSIRFGDTMRIALEQTYHEAVNLVGRVCVDDEYAPSIELVKLDKLSQSNSQYGEGELPNNKTCSVYDSFINE